MKRVITILLFATLALLPHQLKAETGTGYMVGIGCLGPEDCRLPVLEDILNEMYRRVGITPKFKYLPMLRDLRSVSCGVTDASGSRSLTSTESCANIVTLDEPITELEYRVYSMKDLPEELCWKDLEKYRLGILRGDIAASRRAMKHGLKVQMTNSFTSAFMMLRHNRFEMLLTNALSAEMHLKKLGMTGQVISRPLFRNKVYHVVNERHRELVPRLNQSLKDMRNDGFMKNTAKNYSITVP